MTIRNEGKFSPGYTTKMLMLSSCKKPTVVPRAKIFGKTTGEVILYIRMALAIREVSQFFLKAT